MRNKCARNTRPADRYEAGSCREVSGYTSQEYNNSSDERDVGKVDRIRAVGERAGFQSGGNARQAQEEAKHQLGVS